MTARRHTAFLAAALALASARAAVLPTASAATAEMPRIGWQEAVARLAGERTRAEACAAGLKGHADPAAADQAAPAYGESKAEVDAVIAGLVVAVSRGEEPESLPRLEARLRRGVKGRKAFCAEADRLTAPRPGEKGPLTDLVGGAVGPVVDVVKALVLEGREADRLTRKTIQTQLEAAAWPAFAVVTPAS